MPFRRPFVATLAVALLATSLPGPASAMSTAAEVAQAQAQEKQILSQYNLVTDPLLNAWVNGVAEKDWSQVARRDLPYNIKILDADDVNSFTTGGGYIYINAGLLDFVQSDDELAGVIGHETGHNERRHTVTLPAKAQMLNLLFGIASMFSPFIYRFGELAEAGIIAKQSRADELQADQYGLLLMTRAGYDPDAMVSFMKHLGAAQADHDSAVDKYFEDHPGFPDRVAHLVGYPELDPKVRTNDQILVAGLHDADEARYNIAAMKMQTVLRADPNNALAMLHLGESQVALGEPEKGAQTLAEAAAHGTPVTRDTATSNIKSLRESQSTFMFATRPNLSPLRDQLAAARARETAVEATLQTRRDAGRDLIKSVNNRVQNITYGIPNLANIQIRNGSRLDAVVRNFNAMGRSIDAAIGKSTAVINGVGTLEANKQSGLIKENVDILGELSAPLAVDPVPPQSLALLPSYPKMLGDLALADGDMTRALDASRSSLAMLDVSMSDLNDFITALGHARLDYGGDISTSDYNALLPQMQKAATGLSNAAIAASQAQQLYNMARSRQLQTRITMLGLGFPSDRFATLRYALQQRVKSDGISFATMNRDDLTPGDVATATIIAADTNATPDAVIADAGQNNRTLVDEANARGMSARALEIFLGLIYLDYTDDPLKEARGH